MIFNIQHFSIHDGPGIRTVVFFKGCPLRCKWCANPESQSSNAEIMWLENECLRCKSCHVIENMNFHFEDDRLEWGSPCAAVQKIEIQDSTRRQIEMVCPTKAIQVVGKERTIEQILAEVEKDVSFFSESGGGLTVSGGEPLMQGEFLVSLLKEAGKRKIHRAMETSFFARYEVVRKAVQELEYLLVDVKTFDEKLHIENTGVSNKIILENIARIRSDFPNLPIKVRTPVIPGVNDTDQEIEAISNFVKSLGPNTEYELLKYHRLGISKYKSLRRNYPLADVVLSEEKFRHLNTVREKNLWQQINTIAYDGSHI
ncbi:MAG: glycyl-radical enzyme activating protein [Treponemataceae bacterium]|nr:glycyl-radical enzyme activating protein [Treponemataceae bacterium]